LTIRSRAANGEGTLTGIYNGNFTNNQPGSFLMDLSGVGSKFTMSMGWTINPAGTLQDIGSNVGNLIAMMGMVSAPGNLTGVHLGSAPSLYTAVRETGANQTASISIATVEVRSNLTTNATTPPALGTLSTGTNFRASNDPANQYFYYLFDITYQNTGYSGSNATFGVSMNIAQYSMNVTTGVATLANGTFASGSSNFTSTLNATQLMSMRPALGIHIVNGADVSVTGTTYDHFATAIVPEPTAVFLLGLGAMLYTSRRRRNPPPASTPGQPATRGVRTTA